MKDAKTSTPLEILVYLVDDEPEDLEIASDALLACRTPNRVKTFRNGQELVDAMVSPSNEGDVREYPDLILLDLQMPVMNGLQTLEWIRGQERLAQTPVIIFSSVQGEDREQIDQAFQIGCNGFIDKNEVDIDLTESLDMLEKYWISKATARPKMPSRAWGSDLQPETMNSQK